MGTVMNELPTTNLATSFAPAERADIATIRAEQQLLARTEFMLELLDSMQDLVMVLNQQRQIIAVNKRLLETFHISDSERMSGLRPGEALGCIQCNKGTHGCGTGVACSVCGAVLTILASQRTQAAARGECSIVLEQNGGTSLELEVMASPITLDGCDFTCFSIRDVSSAKRRRLLEHLFFHDILNTAGGIQGVASLLTDDVPAEKAEQYKEWLLSLSESLIEDIQHQKQLLDAEKGELVPQLERLTLSPLLEELAQLYSKHERTPNRIVELKQAPPCELTTDRSLLRRVIGNMLINALEASGCGDTVTLTAECDDHTVTIAVINRGTIPEEVRLQLFKRSFSTKQTSGRGIGTYSMKLFGERYLGGQVRCNCSDTTVTFSITLPRTPSSAGALPA